MSNSRSAELIDLLIAGRSEKMEFCDENCNDLDLAKHLVAFLNSNGGTIAFGIEDDGQVIGLNSSEIEFRIAEITANLIFPAIIPNYYEEKVTGKPVGILEIPAGNEKPYYFNSNGKHHYWIRSGKFSRKISPNQIQTLRRHAGNQRYELTPVPNAGWEHLDPARVRNFLNRTREVQTDACTESQLWNWLVNLELGVIQAENFQPTVAGILLLGKEPDRFIAHARIKIVIYNTDEPSQDSLLMEVAGPLLPIYDGEPAQILTKGLIEKVLEIFDENLVIEEANTIRPRFPRAIVTELITNALVHRDYVNPEARLIIEIFPNHFEITSPGGLPPNQTITKIQAGFKVTSNPLLYNYLAESHYFQKNELALFKLIAKPTRDPQIKSFTFEPAENQVKISCWLT